MARSTQSVTQTIDDIMADCAEDGLYQVLSYLADIVDDLGNIQGCVGGDVDGANKLHHAAILVHDALAKIKSVKLV